MPSHKRAEKPSHWIRTFYIEVIHKCTCIIMSKTRWTSNYQVGDVGTLKHVLYSWCQWFDLIEALSNYFLYSCSICSLQSTVMPQTTTEKPVWTSNDHGGGVCLNIEHNASFNASRRNLCWNTLSYSACCFLTLSPMLVKNPKAGIPSGWKQALLSSARTQHMNLYTDSAKISKQHLSIS